MSIYVLNVVNVPNFKFLAPQYSKNHCFRMCWLLYHFWGGQGDSGFSGADTMVGRGGGGGEWVSHKPLLEQRVSYFLPPLFMKSILFQRLPLKNKQEFPLYHINIDLFIVNSDIWLKNHRSEIETIILLWSYIKWRTNLLIMLIHF